MGNIDYPELADNQEKGGGNQSIINTVFVFLRR
jgi:hypothetical protein